MNKDILTERKTKLMGKKTEIFHLGFNDAFVTVLSTQKQTKEHEQERERNKFVMRNVG